MSWGWKGAVIAYAILPTCLIVLFTFLSIAEQLTFTFYFLVIGVFFCQFLQLLPTCTFKFAQHYNTVIVYKSRKWGMTKRPLGFFGKFFKSPALCLQVENGAGLGGCGACSLLQRCLVCHLTVDCRTAIPPPDPHPRSANRSCYIFHLKNPWGHQCVWLCWLKPDGGFPINKCTGCIYTDCGTWRHNTHDTLFSGQSCHKSL